MEPSSMLKIVCWPVAVWMVAAVLTATPAAQEPFGPSTGAQASSGSDPSPDTGSDAEDNADGPPLGGGGNSRANASGGQGTVEMGDGEETIPNTKTPKRLKDGILIDTIPLTDVTGAGTGDDTGAPDGGAEVRIELVGRPGALYAIFLGSDPETPSVMLSVDTMPGTCHLTVVVPLPSELMLMSVEELSGWTFFVYQVGEAAALTAGGGEHAATAGPASALSAREVVSTP